VKAADHRSRLIVNETARRDVVRSATTSVLKRISAPSADPADATGDRQQVPHDPESEKGLFAGTSHAGGGTRTPDTRIMIPLL
jgi:hypothetical protein